MFKTNTAELKANLSKLLRDLASGREDVVVVCHRNVPVAELRAIAPRRKEPRPFGLATGLVVIEPSFFEPLPDEVIDAFEGP